MENIEIPKRLLFKWIGGKKWLTNTLQLELLKFDITKKDTYVEPFIGGMGAFLALFPTLKNNNIKEYILNDINEIIILTYNFVKKNPNAIIKELSTIEGLYDNSIVDKKVHSLNKTKDKIKVKELLKDSESFFKERRGEFNILKKITNRSIEEDIKTVAIFLFLQDHSFNGVYRENNSGGYNTPFNWDNKKYNIDNKTKTILEYSSFFNKNNIKFKNLDVFDLLHENKNKNNIFIYLDPPYLNIEERNENQYNKDHFGLEEQKKLLNSLENYDTFMFSNHLLPLFEEYFSKKGHKFNIVRRKNIMTSKKSDRGLEILEILGTKGV